MHLNVTGRSHLIFGLSTGLFLVIASGALHQGNGRRDEGASGDAAVLEQGE